MSSYKNIILVFLLLFLFVSCAKQTTQIDTNRQYKQNEDMAIMFALEAMTQGDYKSSFEMFYSLYKATKKFEYLEKSIELAIFNHQFALVTDLIKGDLQKNFPQEAQKYEFIYALSLLNSHQAIEGLKVAKELNQKDPSTQNQMLLANMYILNQDYDKAYEILEPLQKKERNNIGLTIVLSDILFNYYKKHNEAIELLDEYITRYGCNIMICERIYTYYMVLNDVDGMIKTLKRNYEFKMVLHQTQEAYETLNIIIEMLKLKNIDVAIEFVSSLPDNEYQSLKFIELYEVAKNKEKMLFYFNKLYEQTKELDILAQLAMFEFESSTNKHEVLNSVIQKLKTVLETSTNHNYQNYLGYLLIDFDIDYKEGILLVQKALLQDPDNYAYMDSLAWGYYKTKEYKKAYEIMKKVVDDIGLEHEEIRLHWQIIKEHNK